MSRLKTLGVLAGFIAVLAVSAAPASAWWEATGEQSKGKVKILTAGVFSEGEGTAKAEVKCPAEGIEALWSIQTKGQIKIHNKEGKQEQILAGPHLHINVLKWGPKCLTKVGGAEPPQQTVVKPCEMQAVQPQKGATTATGGLVTECNVKTSGCEIIVPAGMETQPGSNEGINVGLKEIKLEKVAGELNSIAKINVGGIHSGKPVNALCPLLSSQTNGELKGVEGELEGAKIA